MVLALVDLLHFATQSSLHSVRFLFHIRRLPEKRGDLYIPILYVPPIALFNFVGPSEPLAFLASYVLIHHESDSYLFGVGPRTNHLSLVLCQDRLPLGQNLFLAVRQALSLPNLRIVLLSGTLSSESGLVHRIRLVRRMTCLGMWVRPS